MCTQIMLFTLYPRGHLKSGWEGEGDFFYVPLSPLLLVPGVPINLKLEGLATVEYQQSGVISLD